MLENTHDCKIPSELVPVCPVCGEKLKLPKTEELEVIFIKCSCGCGSFIQVRNGYHIPSKRGIEKVF